MPPPARRCRDCSAIEPAQSRAAPARPNGLPDVRVPMDSRQQRLTVARVRRSFGWSFVGAPRARVRRFVWLALRLRPSNGPNPSLRRGQGPWTVAPARTTRSWWTGRRLRARDSRARVGHSWRRCRRHVGLGLYRGATGVVRPCSGMVASAENPAIGSDEAHPPGDHRESAGCRAALARPGRPYRRRPVPALVAPARVITRLIRAGQRGVYKRFDGRRSNDFGRSGRQPVGR